jgi:hypothetical protein
MIAETGFWWGILRPCSTLWGVLLVNFLHNLFYMPVAM